MLTNKLPLSLFMFYITMFIEKTKYNIEIQNLLLSIKKRIEKYFCPCCESSVPQWLDWNPLYLQVQCPRCYTFPRHRLFTLYLNQNPHLLQDNFKILHFAPEHTLRRKFSSRSNLDYITADLNDLSVDVQIDITRIPFADNTFDIIICSHVLEHIPDDRQAMRELFRILKPGGWSFLQIPFPTSEKTFEDPTITSPVDRLHYFGQEDHVRVYGFDYKERLESVGFTIKLEDVSQNLSEAEKERFGVLKYPEKLYIGLKLHE